MTAPKISVVIPVFNKWELTRDCLKSLAANTEKGTAEIIVVDNASSDVTPKAARFLGESLFGADFKYIRNEQNRNFAGASNQGAEQARGEFIVFLNNDTVVQPGWLPPLLQDFADYGDIAATGPLLLYPDQTPFGVTAQHLGVAISPFMGFLHLYRHLPADSRLAKKRRFFQAITAACLVIPKNLFLEAGKFDEGFINGFEDVDLCGRLSSRGYKFTVNPASVVQHRESQTPGRGNNDHQNSQRLLNGNLILFHPDWGAHLEKDGFTLNLDEWLFFNPRLQPRLEMTLNAALPKLPLEELKQLVMDHIYWEKGWQKLLAETEGRPEHPQYIKMYFKLFSSMRTVSQALAAGKKHGDRELVTLGLNFIANAWIEPRQLLKSAEAGRNICLRHGLEGMAASLETWMSNYEDFKNRIFANFVKERRETLKQMGLIPPQ